MKTLKQFFEDIHRIADCMAANRMQETLVRLSPEDRELLMNFRRRRPAAKKPD